MPITSLRIRILLVELRIATHGWNRLHLILLDHAVVHLMFAASFLLGLGRSRGVIIVLILVFRRGVNFGRLKLLWVLRRIGRLLLHSLICNVKHFTFREEAIALVLLLLWLLLELHLP